MNKLKKLSSLIIVLVVFVSGAINYINAQSLYVGDSVTGENYGGVPNTYTFNRDLSQGMSGQDVQFLQCILNVQPVSGYFGNITKNAVISFQNAHRDQILAPVGLTAGTGAVGSSTRAYLNEQVAQRGGTGNACQQTTQNNTNTTNNNGTNNQNQQQLANQQQQQQNQFLTYYLLLSSLNQQRYGSGFNQNAFNQGLATNQNLGNNQFQTLPNTTQVPTSAGDNSITSNPFTDNSSSVSNPLNANSFSNGGCIGGAYNIVNGDPCPTLVSQNQTTGTVSSGNYDFGGKIIYNSMINDAGNYLRPCLGSGPTAETHLTQGDYLIAVDNTAALGTQNLSSHKPLFLLVDMTHTKYAYSINASAPATAIGQTPYWNTLQRGSMLLGNYVPGNQGVFGYLCKDYTSQGYPTLSNTSWPIDGVVNTIEVTPSTIPSSATYNRSLPTIVLNAFARLGFPLFPGF